GGALHRVLRRPRHHRLAAGALGVGAGGHRGDAADGAPAREGGRPGTNRLNARVPPVTGGHRAGPATGRSAPAHTREVPPLAPGAGLLCVVRVSRQPIWVPVADRASVTGWKKVVPPEVQSPLPPEVRPTALSPEKSEPPLSPGSAQTSVWIRPLTMSPLP